MSATLAGPSAQIIQFPARGRFAAPAVETVKDGGADTLPRVSFGAAWYHEEALHDADPTRKN